MGGGLIHNSTSKRGTSLKFIIFCISEKNQFVQFNDFWLQLNADYSCENKWETFIDKKYGMFLHLRY